MKIFRNCFTLRFRDINLEAHYDKLIYTKYLTYNKLFTMVSTLILIVSTILLISHIPKLDADNHTFSVILYTSVGMSIVSIGLTVLLYVRKVSLLTHRLICYFNAIISYFSFSYYRYYILTLLKLDVSIFYLFLFFEFSARSVVIFTGLMGFLETLLVALFLIISFLVYYSPLISWWSTLPYSFILYCIFIAFLVLSAYFMAREQRKSFYFDQLIKKNITWYENIFDRSNSGFLQITNTKILFANKLMRTKLFQIETSEDINTITPIRSKTYFENKYINENDDMIIKELFDSIEMMGEMGSMSSSTSFLNIIKENYILSKEINFSYLGLKTFLIESIGFTKEELSYEIYYRYYTDDNNVDHFEFIFNDITRTREIEKRNAEFKFKALFLAKVAHEFKNPLICISELIDKCRDISAEMKSNHTNVEVINECSERLEENLFLVNSFSNYLIILTKDLDHFSSKENKKNNQLSINATLLDDILSFVDKVSKGLIVKANKQTNVKFEIIKGESVPESINADEIKLKQVLINLCSNAVKFTQKGKVTLAVDTVDDRLTFTVEDSGIGMTDDRMANLFKPFSTDNNSKNLLGTGLGLSIVSDITRKFGKMVEYISRLGEGSKFWFSIPLTDKEIISERSFDKRSSSSIVLLSPRRPRMQIETSRLVTQNSNRSLPTIRQDFVKIEIDYNKEECESILNVGCQKEYSVVIVDDDKFVRSSAVRIISKVATSLGITLKLTELDDGVELVHYVCEINKSNKEINIIISDETMHFMNGSSSWEILQQMIKDTKIMPVPFFLVTAYESCHFNGFNGVFSKPLTNDNAKRILSILK